MYCAWARGRWFNRASWAFATQCCTSVSTCSRFFQASCCSGGCCPQSGGIDRQVNQLTAPKVEQQQPGPDSRRPFDDKTSRFVLVQTRKSFAGYWLLTCWRLANRLIYNNCGVPYGVEGRSERGRENRRRYCWHNKGGLCVLVAKAPKAAQRWMDGETRLKWWPDGSAHGGARCSTRGLLEMERVGALGRAIG